jgi:hypothetical protein
MEAAFTPRTRAELQGDGTAGGGGVFGCVGACGEGLTAGIYCHADANGLWESGDGNTCANADSDVPSGQGDGKSGAIGSWNVGKVTDMTYSECTIYCPSVCCLPHVSSVSLSLSLCFIYDPTLTLFSSSSSLDVLSIISVL